MAKERERQTTYYIEALPSGDVASTNGVLARNLEPEDTMEEVLCCDGGVRPMWRCPQIKAVMLWNSRHNWESIGFKIRVWQQEGNGSVRIASGNRKNPRFPYGRPRKKTRRPSYAH